MVSGLVVILFLGVMQLGFALHVRNTLISCAAEGARHGARLGATPQDGAARAADLVRASLPDRYAQAVTADVVEAGGVEAVRVHVSAPLPVLGPLGPSRALEVDGRAFLESQ